MIKKYFLIIATIFVVSLIYSRFMVSVSMLLMLVLAIVHGRKSGTYRIRPFVKAIAYSGLVLVFLTVVLSGINSTEIASWLQEVKLKLPFLLLPYAFYVLKPFNSSTHRWVHMVLIAVITVSSLHVIFGYLQDSQSINSGIAKGKSIPMPIDHIHYSLISAYACIAAIIYGVLSSSRWHKVVFYGLGIYLFGFIHFISVRSGIVLSYAGAFIVLCWYVIQYRKFLFASAIGVSMLLLPVVAYHTLKPFQNKIDYMLYDIEQFQKGNGKNYSDSERLMSCNLAVELISDRPLLGHGIGDIDPIMKEMHTDQYGTKEKYIKPHNQYLLILSAMGILGSIFFFGGLLSPLLFAQNRNVFLIVIVVMLLLSFMVENTIQRAVSTGFYLFFILLNLGWEKDAKVGKATLKEI